MVVGRGEAIMVGRGKVYKAFCCSNEHKPSSSLVRPCLEFSALKKIDADAGSRETENLSAQAVRS